MSARGRVIICGRQTGSANAFVPVLSGVAARGYELAIIGFPGFTDPIARRGYRVTTVRDNADFLSALGENEDSELLLSGTSEDAIGDGAVWAWARQAAVPSIGYVESWVNYWQRFSSSGEVKHRFDCTPDIIAAVDETAARSIAQAGFAASRIVVVGNPAFDELTLLDTESVAATRRALLGPERTRLVVFVSQPLSTICDASFSSGGERLGFSEQDAWTWLVHGITAAGGLRNQVHVAVRPHPRESSTDVERWVLPALQKGLSVQVSSMDRLCMVAAADVVVGMNSILLYEALLLGTPVISLQPHRREPCELTDDRAGIEVAVDLSTACEVIESVLTRNDTWRPLRGRHTLACAAEQLCQEVLRFCRSRKDA